MCGELCFENKLCRLIVGEDCIVRSLTLLETGEELLQTGEDIALFSATQERPFNNEVKLAHPNKRTIFQGNRLTREGDRLTVGFELIPAKAVISVTVTDAYIAFKLEDFIATADDYGHLNMDYPPICEVRIVQLPVKNRACFGEWLNVSHDDTAAVCVLSTSPYARIDSERRRGYRVMFADAVRGIKLRGTGAALIVSRPTALLDCIDVLERDFDLPRGVQSRRSEWINRSMFWTHLINPTNVDEHIRYAKMGGFRMMLIYVTSIFKTGYGYGLNGDYDYRPEYPNGRADLVEMLAKLRAAGITPGFHFLQTHVGLKTRYVTPRADHRLNHTRLFTLSRPLSETDTTVYVEQNPEDTVMADKCRVLHFGGELISYEAYTTERPYRFTGCVRGVYETTVEAHPLGLIGGILDITEFSATSAYLDQNTDLQDEIADKIADAYGAGFRFCYFDGSEGTNVPFGFHVPNAQYRVYKKFTPAPLFTEGAAKAHFSWHFLSGGNAFDIFRPEVFKKKIAQFPAEEAPRMRQDFTRLNFGWWGFWNPGAKMGSEITVTGTQPDMYEYGTSRAAAWDCPVSVMLDINEIFKHPRLADNLEVIRRWEDVRANGWLTEEHKETLKNLDQEHILLIDEDGAYELAPYRQLKTSVPEIRAFIITRESEARYVVFWHISGEGKMALDLPAEKLTLTHKLGGEAEAVGVKDGCAVLPIAERRFIKTELSEDALVKAFETAKLI
ncbi:MAG: hypothetical protein GX929_03935 [Clostridiales bacterium]|nr:hypothetical protein [Clostridiales bacterium]